MNNQNGDQTSNTTNPRTTESASLLEVLNTVNRVVAVGSVDGICTAAAVVRNAAAGCDIVFTQAFTVDTLDPKTWGEKKTVLFVDLAVNNRQDGKGMTAAFLRRVVEAGHQIVGVCDEHNAEDWQAAFAEAGLDFDALALKPVTGKGTAVNSSGALLLSLLGSDADRKTIELCSAADAGDRMDFSTHFGGIVNQAVKSAIQDDRRRVYLAQHFSLNNEPDETIAGWVAEYDKILATHDAIIEDRQDLEDGLVKVVIAPGQKIDMTAFMSRLYKLGYKVVVLDGESFNQKTKQKERQISFGCAPGVKVDLRAGLEAAGIAASGFAEKANIAPADEAAAIMVVKVLIA